MKRLVLFSLVVPLLLPGISTGQSNSVTHKVATVSGQVSQGGKSLIGKNGASWSVENPDALAGHEGQLVKVKCWISSGSRGMHVLRIVATQARYAVNLGDSAFRR